MKSSRIDAIVSVVVILGVAGLLWLFAIDIGFTSSRGDEQALGTVIFKRLSATRRPAAGLGWERIRNASPVYNADTLRTSSLSEAAIFFDDDTSLELDENSMIRLDFGESRRNLEFLDGEITLGGSTNGSSYMVSSLAGTIAVGTDSNATFRRDVEKNVLAIEVNRGTATLTRVDGSSETVQANQALAVSLEDGSSHLVSRPIVQVLPQRNARVLLVAEPQVLGSEIGTTSVPFEFAWVLEGGTATIINTLALFTLELSAEKTFSANPLARTVRGLSASVPVAAGLWYWRVRDESGQLSAVRKFSLDIDSSPRPAFPEDGARYRYRLKPPEIRFAWTTMKNASAYIFELSDSSNFEKLKLRTRISGSNFSVSELGEGNWYWRVSPIHGYSAVQGATIPTMRSLIIEKSGDMTELTPSTPLAGHLYQIQELSEKGLPFAWTPQAEAVSYDLLVSNTDNFSNPTLVLQSSTPYMRVSFAMAGELSKEGSRFWGVRWIDKEGNKSAVSTARRIVGIDGSIAMRLVFPPEGYRIADSLASNVRFTWKSNVAAPTVFLLARDPAFKDIVFQQPVSAETMIGKAWGTGTWYWKIRTLNADNSAFMETPARSCIIVEPLAKGNLHIPASGLPFSLRHSDTIKLVWNSVPGADYYTVMVYAPMDGYSKPIFEKAHLTENSVVMPLGLFPSGRYALRVQGFALETDMSTRVIGYMSDSYLLYWRLEYLKLASPPNGAVFDGLDALRKGVTLRYQTVNPPDTKEFRLYKSEAGIIHEVIRSSAQAESFVAKKLRSGQYLWTVGGQLAGFDISSLDTWHFDVLPIPPLAATVIKLPAKGTVLGVQELRGKRSIDFVWQTVPDSTRYTFSLFPEGASIPSLIRDDITEPSFILTDFHFLSKGKNTVRVEAVSIEEDGEIARTGTPVEQTFIVDLPPATPVQTKTESTLYGR